MVSGKDILDLAGQWSLARSTEGIIKMLESGSITIDQSTKLARALDSLVKAEDSQMSIDVKRKMIGLIDEPEEDRGMGESSTDEGGESSVD